MPKIVRVFAVMEPNLHQQALDEANFLSNAAKAAGQAVKNVANKVATKVAAKTAAAADPNAEPEENAASADDSTKQAQPLDTIVSALTNTPTGVQRFAIHMSHEDFAAYFLKSDPASRAQLAANLLAKGQKGSGPAIQAAKPATESALSLLQLVEVLAPINGGKASDRQAAQQKLAASNAAQPAQPAIPAGQTEKPAQQPPTKKPVQQKQGGAPKIPPPSIGMMNNGYKFSSLFNTAGNNDYTVLMNIPSTLASSYQAAVKGSDKAELGKVLSQVLNHKYYVMTLNNPMAKKIAAGMDSAHNLEEKKAAFNPNCIVNHPSKQLLTMAKNEWNQEHAEAHAAANAPAKEEPKPDTDSVKSAETAMGQTKPDSAAAATVDGAKPADAEAAAAAPTSAAETPPEKEDNSAQGTTAKMDDLWKKFLKHNGGNTVARPTPEMISMAKAILNMVNNHGPAE